MGYIKYAITKQNSTELKNLCILDGINGSGKTTMLREIIKCRLGIWKKSIDLYIYKKKEREQYTWTTEVKAINKMEYEPAIELYYFIGLKTINKIVEIYSSGQKKKLTLVSLLIGNSQIWYMDEPKNYLDNLAYNILKNRMKRHLNIGGKVVITTNTSILFKDIKKKISLSRFELLTTRLSSECSTTEL